MTCMRTTLTLDDDVVRLVEDAVHRERRPMKQVINDALRRALAPPVKRQEQYRLEPHESAVRSGLDLAGFNKLADELEDEALLDATRRARGSSLTSICCSTRSSPDSRSTGARMRGGKTPSTATPVSG
ncbi:antitoxin [Mycobacterium tuberculosis]|nr:antitoxin [Mycobacterium tuberculosis]